MERDDTISRLAAIEAVDKNRDTVFHNSVDYEGVLHDISNLPPALPTQCNSSNILRHPQCANRTKLGNCDPVGGFCTSVPKEICDAQEYDTLNGSDLISRQKAQTELMMKCERYTLARESHGMGHVEWSDELIDLSDAMDAIRDLPSAQLMPEPDKERISDLLKSLYLSRIVYLTKEAIVSRQHYCEELWKAIFHDDEFPVWMHWS